MVISILQFIACLSCVLFAGAAIYINVAEHPARLECGTRLAATVFGPSYRRAAMMQASLALISTFAATIVWIANGSLLWLVGAMFIFSVVPFTFIAIMPANKQLMDPDLDHDAENTRQLLLKWGRLHAVRSVLSVIASCLFLFLLLTN